MSEKENNIENTPSQEEMNENVQETQNEAIQEETQAVEETVVEEVKAEETKVETVEEPKEEAPKRMPRPTEPPEFDWESGNVDVDYNASEQADLEKEYSETMKSIETLQVIDGTIVAMTDREVVINIGYKSEGVVALNEFRYNPDLKIGDTVEVYIEQLEDPKGQLLLSHKKARILSSWDRVNKAEANDEIITGYVKSRTKGGLIVDVFGIEAFLPGSQIDVKPIRDFDAFVDKTMELKVVKINHEFKNVVVSHKALIEDELEAQKAEIIKSLEKGQVLEGTVKNITSYGVFIDLGGVDGLIHITDLSWGRINHPEEIVELDQTMKVVILDFDENKKRIALGLKQLQPHPWDSLDTELKVGDKVKGKIVVVADYGAFIEILPGVEGLIHVSEMSWSQHLRTAHDFLKVNAEVEAEILTLDREERKMSLGMKQLIPDPWQNIASKYPIGSKHNAKVRNFTNFGIFVEMEEGVDGLIHISDLSWSKKIKHPAEFTKIGEMMDVVVLDVDKDTRRLSLGHKQLEENPWDVFESVFTEGSSHKGTVTEANDKGTIVALPYGVEGFVPRRHVKKEDGTNLKIDDTLDFVILEFNKENKKIILSHTQTFQVKAEEKATTERKGNKKALKKLQDNVEKTTLGDLDVLANLKKSMEKDAKDKLDKMAKEKKGAAVEKVEEVEKTEDADPKVEEKEGDDK